MLEDYLASCRQTCSHCSDHYAWNYLGGRCCGFDYGLNIARKNRYDPLADGYFPKKVDSWSSDVVLLHPIQAKHPVVLNASVAPVHRDYEIDLLCYIR